VGLMTQSVELAIAVRGLGAGGSVDDDPRDPGCERNSRGSAALKTPLAEKLTRDTMSRPQAVSGLSALGRSFMGRHFSGSSRQSMPIAVAYGKDLPSFALEAPKGPTSSLAEVDMGVEAEEVEELDTPAEGTASVVASIFVLANTIMGTGLLALPGVCAALGIFWFVMLMILASSIACFTVHLLARGSLQATEKSFVALGEAAFGKAGGTGSIALMIIQTFCTLTTYFVLAKDMGGNLLGMDKEGAKLQRSLLAVAIALVLFPLCLLRDISALKPTCYFAVSVFAMVVLACVWGAALGETSALRPESTHTVNVFDMDFKAGMLAIPGAILAFVCHHTALPIYASLKGGDPAKMDCVAVGSFALVFVLYTTVGICGYLAFPEFVKPGGKLEEAERNVLEAMPTTPVYKCLRVAMMIAVLFGYPCIHFGSRKAVMTAILGKRGLWTIERHIGVTCGIMGITLSAAIILPDLKTALEWSGSTVSVAMMFLFPVVCFLGLRSRLTPGCGLAVRTGLACAVAVMGLLVIVGFFATKLAL